MEASLGSVDFNLFKSFIVDSQLFRMARGQCFKMTMKSSLYKRGSMFNIRIWKSFYIGSILLHCPDILYRYGSIMLILLWLLMLGWATGPISLFLIFHTTSITLWIILKPNSQLILSSSDSTYLLWQIVIMHLYSEW